MTLTTCIAEIYNKLYNTTLKLLKTASSIGFIKKDLYNKVTLRFAQINGQFINKQDQVDAQRKLMQSHLNRTGTGARTGIIRYRKLSLV